MRYVVERNHYLFDVTMSPLGHNVVRHNNPRMDLIIAKFFENPLMVLPTELYFMCLNRPCPSQITLSYYALSTLEKHCWSTTRFLEVSTKILSEQPLDMEQVAALDIVSDMIFIVAAGMLYGSDYAMYTDKKGFPVRTVIEDLGDAMTTLVDDCEGLFKIMGDLAFLWREQAPRKSPVVAAVQDILRQYVFMASLRSVTASNMRQARGVDNIDKLNR